MNTSTPPVGRPRGSKECCCEFRSRNCGCNINQGMCTIQNTDALAELWSSSKRGVNKLVHINNNGTMPFRMHTCDSCRIEGPWWPPARIHTRFSHPLVQHGNIFILFKFINWEKASNRYGLNYKVSKLLRCVATKNMTKTWRNNKNSNNQLRSAEKPNKWHWWQQKYSMIQWLRSQVCNACNFWCEYCSRFHQNGGPEDVSHTKSNGQSYILLLHWMQHCLQSLGMTIISNWWPAGYNVTKQNWLSWLHHYQWPDESSE